MLIHCTCHLFCVRRIPEEFPKNFQRIAAEFLKNSKIIPKENSVQEAWAKCFAVHLLKFEILQTTWKTKQKPSKCYLLVKNWKLIVFALFFDVICKISNFNMWTGKHLAQASCTEMTFRAVASGGAGGWQFLTDHLTLSQPGGTK